MFKKAVEGSIEMITEEFWKTENFGINFTRCESTKGERGIFPAQKKRNF